MLTSAFAILWILAAFLGVWGVSLVWRGVFADPAPRRWWLIAAGVVVIIGAGVGVYFGQVVYAWTHPGADPWRPPGGIGAWEAGAWGVAAFGVLLAVWAWRGDRSRGRRRCPKCWYDMTGVGLKCPECGHEATAVKQLYRPRRRWKTAALGALILMSSWIVPRVMAGGWVAAIPTTALIAGIPWLPESALFHAGRGRPPTDWTLQRRLESAWPWQRALLRWRARSLLERSEDARTIGRALQLLDGREPPELWPRLQRVLVEALCRESRRQREAASHWAYIALSRQEGTRSAGVALTPLQVERLVALFEDPSAPVAYAAMLVMAGFEPQSQVTLQGITRVLSNEQGRSVRANGASHAWRVMGEQSEPARQAARDAIAAEPKQLHAAAVRVLGHVAHFDPATADFIGVTLRDGDDTASQRAARALARTGMAAETAIPEILAQAEGSRSGREDYIKTLAEYGGLLGPFVPRVADLTSDPSAGVRLAALELLLELTQFSVDLTSALAQARGRVLDDVPAVAAKAQELVQRIEEVSAASPGAP